MGSLFITGFSGFIGSNLLRRIDPTRYEKVYCLGRTKPAIPFPENFEFIRGCLCDTNSYARFLDSCDTVIHLAAATGKAVPSEYFNVNTKGTRVLIEECERRKVRNFLYVSTIAAKFSDKTRYYYAQSKEQGEQAVKASNLNYAIVRPTIVIGKEAVIWKSLSALARKPVLLILGDGKTRVQPIYIEDLIDCLLMILEANYFSNEVFELGGPEQITFEHLLRRIHHIYHGKEPAVVHLPLKLLTTTVALLERAFYSLLPINTGQLSAFNNDGTIEMNRLFSVAAPQMRNVNSMLGQMVAAKNRDVAVHALDNQCIHLSRYLLNQEPTAYVIDKYRDALFRASFVESTSAPFDRFLTWLATRHRATAKLVDCYTGVFHRTASIRKKLILLVAIFESCAPTYTHFEAPESTSLSVLIVKTIWQGIGFVTCLLLSTLLLTPVRMILAVYSGLRGK